MRKGSRLVWPAQVTIRVGEAIETAGQTMDDRDGLIARTRNAIQRLLEQGA